MNQLGILLKTQMKASWGASRRERMKDKKYAGKMVGYGVLMVFVGLMMVGLVFGFSYIMAEPLAQMGMLDLMPALMMAAASVFCLVTTVYKANGALFAFKDYDLVMSLPIRTSTIVTSRMTILYSMNILFALGIMIPSGIVYSMFAQVSAAYWAVLIISTFIIPLVPIVIATIIGSLIAVAASHFKKKAGANMVITVAAMLVWMLFCFNMNGIAQNFVTYGSEVVNVLNMIYPLTGMYTRAVCQMDAPSLLLFWGISIGAFVAFALIVGKNFRHIHSFLTANRTQSNYKMQELKQSIPKKALFQKEWKRFTSSSAYMMNTAIGVILLTAVSVLMLIFGTQFLSDYFGADIKSSGIASVIPIGMSFFVIMTYTTACSISLEGKNFWIIKSLPVNVSDVLNAKIRVNLTLVIPAVLVNSTIFSIVFAGTALDVLMMFITPLVYGLFITYLGLQMNLSNPNFEWENELKVIKQSMPAMVTMFAGMGIVIGPAIAGAILGPVVLYVTTAVLAVVSLLMYRRLMTKGVRQFDALEV